MDCHYPAQLFRDYYRFAFVRNPWDRLVSCWQNKVIAKNYFGSSHDVLLEMQIFKNFLTFVEDLDLETCDPHLRSQSRLIDLNSIDFIGRFETFQENLTQVIKILGLDSIVIDRKNASRFRSDYSDYYDESLKDRLARLYRRDINIFRYEF